MVISVFGVGVDLSIPNCSDLVGLQGFVEPTIHSTRHVRCWVVPEIVNLR